MRRHRRSVQLSGRQALNEACVRRMDVENPYPVWTRIAEGMLDATWRGKERARAAATPLAINEKLDLTLEDVERVGVIRVAVRIDTLPAELERGVDNLQIRQLREQPEAAIFPVEPLTLAFGHKDCVHRRSQYDGYGPQTGRSGVKREPAAPRLRRSVESVRCERWPEQ